MNLTSQNSTKIGFSLIEIVLALGIMSFALVGILGLFPAAIDTARDSKAETRIALIAQSILADLQASHDPTKQSCEIQTSASSSSTISLIVDSSIALGFDEEGVVQQQILNFTSGSSAHPFIANVTIDYQQPITGPNPPDFPELAKIEIRVDYPGPAPESARKQYRFVTLMNP